MYKHVADNVQRIRQVLLLGATYRCIQQSQFMAEVVNDPQQLPSSICINLLTIPSNDNRQVDTIFVEWILNVATLSEQHVARRHPFDEERLAAGPV